ncbi:helix-turn-helix transcriptional regulator [Pseudarthrobacter oxydans]|uniref:helix-turn-helix domain-containing protein n=1 Tax=Pseudarthrobacter oxydans TaxID=1671 RepID=UPI00343C461F
MSTRQAAGATTADAEIGARITEAIKDKKTDQKALSDSTGIAYATLRRSLTGGRSLTVREITTIADALNIPAVTLLPVSLLKDAA